MVNHYPFSTIFRFDNVTRLITPLVRVRINGVLFPANIPIPTGNGLGGLDVYSAQGKTVEGIMNTTTKELNVIGFK